MTIHPHSPFRSAAWCGALILAAAACAESPSSSTDDRCGEPLRLAVGAAADVRTEPGCPLRAEGGAEYVLAYYDAQLATAAETQPEPYIPAPDGRFTLTVTDATGGARTSRAPAFAELAAPTGPADFQLSVGPRPAVGVAPEGPWRVGDVIQVQDDGCAAGCHPPPPSRVVRVEDQVVFAVSEATLGADVARVEGLIHQAAPLLRQHAIPLLHTVFTAEHPVTTAASGQLVVVLEGDITAGGGVTFSTIRPEGTASHWIRLEMKPDTDVGNLLWLFAHEIAHAFQFEYVARTVPQAGPRGMKGGARWGIEGGATLMDLETLRRAAGVPLDGNTDFRATPTTEVQEWLFDGAHNSGNGFLPGGYYAGAGYLRDLVFRRMGAGDGLEAALREVSRGAVEGWYGLGPDGSRRTGLAARMRTRLPGWDPVESVFTWTLSAAADDATPSPVYQDHTWLRMGDRDLTGRGWPPDRVIDAGSGATHTYTRPLGMSGYLLVRASGGSLALNLGAPASVRWKLLRIS